MMLFKTGNRIFTEVYEHIHLIVCKITEYRNTSTVYTYEYTVRCTRIKIINYYCTTAVLPLFFT